MSDFPPQGQYAQGSSGTFTANGPITFPAGLGAITHILGPTDQHLVIEHPTNATYGVEIKNVYGTVRFHRGGGSNGQLSLWIVSDTGNLEFGANGDVGLIRGGAAAVIKVTDGNTGYGSLRCEYPRRAFGSHKTPGTAATLTAEGGCPTHTLTGTASNLSNSSGAYVLLSGDGTIAGVDIATTETLKTELNPIATFVIRTGTTLPTDATERLWVGFSSASLSAADSPTGAHVMAFRYAIDADGTAFWRTVTNDGGADTGTVTISTIAIAAATRYVLTIDATNPASIKFHVNGALAATHTTNLPTVTTALGTQCFALDAGAGVMELAISKIRIETD